MARELWSLAAGFSIGWWILIDGMAYGAHPPQGVEPIKVKFEFFIPAIGATIALIMINVVSLDDLNADQDFDNRSGKVKAWLFLSFAFSFGCIAGGIAIMAAKFSDNWTGVAILLQPIIIFISAFVLLYARKNPEENEYSTV